MFLKANLPRMLWLDLDYVKKGDVDGYLVGIPVTLELSTQDAFYGDPSMKVTVFEEAKVMPRGRRGGIFNSWNNAPWNPASHDENGHLHEGEILMHEVRLGDLVDLLEEGAFDEREKAQDLFQKKVQTTVDHWVWGEDTAP